MALREFISRVQNVDLARPNKYAVKILGAPVGRDEYIEYMAESVSFPGQNIRASTDLLRYGPQREVAHAMTYGAFNISFMCTTGMPEKLWFESWQDQMVNKNTWEAKFYKDYVAILELVALDRNEKDSYRCTVYEAYPKTITAQEFSYGSNGAYQTVSVEFAYRWWDAVGFKPSPTAVPSLMTPAVAELNPIKAKTQTKEEARASDRHPPPVDESFANAPTTPAPSSDIFYPSPGQPVSLPPSTGMRGLRGLRGDGGIEDNRNK